MKESPKGRLRRGPRRQPALGARQHDRYSPLGCRASSGHRRPSATGTGPPRAPPREGYPAPRSPLLTTKKTSRRMFRNALPTTPPPHPPRPWLPTAGGPQPRPPPQAKPPPGAEGEAAEPPAGGLPHGSARRQSSPPARPPARSPTEPPAHPPRDHLPPAPRGFAACRPHGLLCCRSRPARAFPPAPCPVGEGSFPAPVRKDGNKGLEPTRGRAPAARQ